LDFIRFSITKPVTVLVGVLLIVLFGTVSFTSIPYQLTPKVERAAVTVRTAWPGATPYEIERDIIEEQEKVLKGVEGLEEMESTSSDGSGTISLRFKLGEDMDDALLRVSNKLNEVTQYPENAFKPRLSASDERGQGVAYLSLRPLEGNSRHIFTYDNYFENNIRQFIERVDGVSSVTISGGQAYEMQVKLKPAKLAAHRITIDQVIAALRGENVNVSAGTLGVSRRDYRIRAVSEFRSPADIAKVAVTSDRQRTIRVSDLADVDFGYSKPSSPSLQDGEPSMTVFIQPEPDANVLELTDRIESSVAELNDIIAADGLRLYWLMDQRDYIQGSINLLKQNIVVGGSFAIFILLLFLRSIASTLVVATTIPISIIGTFIFMRIFGTTLNIVSMAGIAFSVGMLVDNAIVVLENIDRHRKMGKSPFEAAHHGTQEVWGAVLASSLTTIAVFLPVIFLQEEAGMLFRDIAIAVTCAVALSLVVSITVIPTFSRMLFENRFIHHVESKTGRESIITRAGHGLSDIFMKLIGATTYNFATRIITIVSLSAGAFYTAYALLPKMEYMPQGNRDYIMNMLIPPPGMSYEEQLSIGEYTFDYMKPYFEEDFEGYPGIERAFFFSMGTRMMCGMVSKDEARTRELIGLSRKMMADIPGVMGISTQAGVFSQGMGRGRAIDVNISGNSIEEMIAATGEMMGAIRQAIPDAQMRPNPPLDLMFPEIRFTPDGEALRAAGMTAQQFGTSLDVIMDGRKIADFKREGDKKIDLILKMDDAHIETPEDVADALLPIPAGMTVPVRALSTMVRTNGLTSIRHLERDRTFSLEVTPPYSITIQEAMEIVEDDVVPELRASGALDNMSVTLGGTADKLTQTRRALQWNFLLAVAITYLLMSALFGNFIYPFVILFTVPLAGAGGFIGLRLVNAFIASQQLDILTMLGFIILVGVVVNNAILIVHQSLNNIRVRRMPHREAVNEATKSRLRPIYMTAATSIFGMLPLVVWPGTGSELYRGLGSVVLGGLAMSTIFTVFLIPSLLMMFIGMEKIPEGSTGNYSDPVGS
jgi:HAE1 family hydrophobic/amphiphilic exporter-1